MSTELVTEREKLLRQHHVATPFPETAAKGDADNVTLLFKINKPLYMQRYFIKNRAGLPRVPVLRP